MNYTFYIYLVTYWENMVKADTYDNIYGDNLSRICSIKVIYIVTYWDNI